MELQKLRKQRNETQQSVADSIGISRAGYANIEEKKRKPSIRVAKLIGEYFGFDWTLFYADEEGGADRDDRGDQEGKERGH